MRSFFKFLIFLGVILSSSKSNILAQVSSETKLDGGTRVNLLATVSEKEPNNTYANAQLITLGNSINGSISSSSDIDIYKVKIDKAGLFNINIKYMFDGSLDISNESGNSIYSYTYIYASSSSPKTITYSEYLEAGTYYIKISGRSDFGKYTIDTAFSKTPNNEKEPNGSYDNAQVLSIGQEVTGLLSQSDGIDMFKITLSQPGYFGLDVKYLFDGSLNISNEAGDSIYSYNYIYASSSSPKTINYRQYLEAGTYYIKITDRSDSGLYYLQSSFTPSKTNEQELNNTINSAQSLMGGQKVKGLISYQDSLDMFKINLSNKSRVILEVTYTFDGRFELIDNDGNTIYNQSYIYASQSDPTTVSYVNDLSAGTYYIKISGRSDTGIYDLKLKSSDTGWKKVNGNYYYYDSEGVMVDGWNFIDGYYYYFNNLGVMQTGWLKENNKWYYLKPSGAMAVGWEKVGSEYYYFEKSGLMKTGWLQSGSKWYYLKPSGAMAVGWEKVGNQYYYFEKSGLMKTGWLKSGSKYYYLKPSGAMAVGWEKVGNQYYYFEKSGLMKTGWLQSGTTWYYLKPSGAMAVGWEKIGQDWYYFYSSGKMATNITIGGWKITSNGKAYKL